jgi:hypothetical protein
MMTLMVCQLVMRVGFCVFACMVQAGSEGVFEFLNGSEKLHVKRRKRNFCGVHALHACGALCCDQVYNKDSQYCCKNSREMTAWDSI